MSVPIYENLRTLKPVPEPRVRTPALVASATLSRTLPIGEVCGNEKVVRSKCGLQDVASRGRADKKSHCTEECCSCSRLSVELGNSWSSSQSKNVGLRKEHSDSDSSDCEDSILSHRLSLRDYPRKDPDNDSAPPIPPKRLSMASDQNNLFHQVPPPSTSSNASTTLQKAFSSTASTPSVKSFNPNTSFESSKRLVTMMPPLTEHVPPLPKKPPEDTIGYVPHKPDFEFPMDVNGYLKMKKPSSVEDHNNKAPFVDLWPPDAQMSEDDPEYCSTSDLYADEPLYQVYHREAVVRDVLEQTMEDDEIDDEVEYETYETILTAVLKRTSEKRDLEMGKPDITSIVENLIPAGVGIRRLWSDNPQVKRSGILKSLSAEAKKHQECLFEIITSEASYLKSLKLLETHFIENSWLSGLLSRTDSHYLFSNVKSIIVVGNKMLQELELIWKKSVILEAKDICQTLKTIAQRHYKDVYVPYLANATFQERKLSELNNRFEFRSIVAGLENASEVHGLKLQSFLILPMQRVTRIPLLIDAVLQGVAPESPVFEIVSDSLTVFQQILTSCNEMARQIETLEQLNRLSNQLTFKKTCRTIPIVSRTRRIIKTGELVQIKATQKPSPSKPITFLSKLQQLHQKVVGEKCIRHFFLFNDLLLIAKKRNNQYEVIGSTEKQKIDALVIDESNVLDHLPNGIPNGCNFLFCLTILDEGNNEMILSSGSENERMRWIEACSSSLRNEDDETIYEINDCPQVQAIKRFCASEPDEMGLEESDIVHVLRKTQDGWYEGERLRDGRRGWFLASHTVEIESAHKRAKNRKQQWRLMKQSQTFQGQNFT